MSISHTGYGAYALEFLLCSFWIKNLEFTLEGMGVFFFLHNEVDEIWIEKHLPLTNLRKKL